MLARNALANFYQSQLYSVVVCPQVPNNSVSAWAQYTIRLTTTVDRDRLKKSLSESSIPTAVYYPLSLNQQPALSHHPSADTPNSNLACLTVLSLPMHGYMDDSTQSAITQKVIEIISTDITNKKRRVYERTI